MTVEGILDRLFKPLQELISDPGLNPGLPVLAGRHFTTEPPGEPIGENHWYLNQASNLIFDHKTDIFLPIILRDQDSMPSRVCKPLP